MKNNLPYQQFIILGTARTGSTMLWSYLNSHPDILCLRGVYGPRNKINFGKFYKELPEEYHSSQMIKLRNERPIDFLENYVWKEYSKPFKAVGFKYFYDHDRHLSKKKEVINYFETNRDIKFLHLKRDNQLATLFSYKRALSEQQWTKANTDFFTSITVEECNDHFQQILYNQKRFDEMLKNRTLNVSYDNLLEAPELTLHEILNFIGVKSISLETETKKNREIKLSDGIINYNELKTHFKGTDFAKHFNE